MDVVNDYQGIKGLKHITPKMFNDERGYFFESYNARELEKAGIADLFVQDNQSFSYYGTVRGLHFQINHPQSKLVRVISGKVFDVAVDLRPDSETFGKWASVILDSEVNNMFYIPEGFAHGFEVLSTNAIFAYKVNDFYHPNDEGGIMWNDPDLKINWPIMNDELIISEKDQNNLSFQEYKERFIK